MPSSSPEAIRLAGVNKSYGSGDLRSQVLFDIDLTLPAGEMILVVGPSGCGKTTLISIIASILEVDRGEIAVFGTRVDQLSDTEKTAFRRDNIGFIFQQFNLLPTLTAQENAAVPLLIQKIPRKEAFERAAVVLDQVGLGSRLDALPRDLSGGQQQRIAIARSLVLNPRLMVCDEPTASLDQHTGQTVMDLLRSVAIQPGRCVIVVTHDSRIFDYGDRMVEMNDGRVTGVHAIPHRASADAPSS